MRPVNKGKTPYTSISNFGEVLPYIEERIGCYCSYCEFPISHVPEVEHVFAKSKGGDETSWDNLFLACKYCNTRKGTIIGDNLKNIWLWPDIHNTFLAFTYENSIPKVNKDFLKSINESVFEKANKMFSDLKLDNIPCSHKDRDRRWLLRLKTFNKTREYYQNWQKYKKYGFKEQFLKSIYDLAKSEGFFICCIKW